MNSLCLKGAVFPPLYFIKTGSDFYLTGSFHNFIINRSYLKTDRENPGKKNLPLF